MKRLDKLLLEQGLVSSRTQAQKLIAAGAVSVCIAGQKQTIDKPSVKLSDETEISVEDIDELKYLSRAGLKLESAFAQLQSSGFLASAESLLGGATVLDIGQSTGGFTDFALQKGASKVVGVDVGHNQLHRSLREHNRVVCLEGVNARNLPAADLLQYSPDGYDLVVMDISFISQTLVAPHLAACLKPKGLVLSLVKPQFEVGKDGIGKGGIVRDRQSLDGAERKVKQSYAQCHLKPLAYCPSAIKGADGNQEFFLLAGLADNEHVAEDCNTKADDGT